MPDFRVIEADCRKAMATMPEAFVDAIVTDPPYELDFMGKAWDRSGVAFQPETWVEALRVLKPGGHLLAFGGTRTYHRLTCAIEDAGFEIRDCLAWMYGSGFPKHDSCLKPAHEPIMLGRKTARRSEPLQIDACRIGSGDIKGRWPANVVLDPEAGTLLDAQSGEWKTNPPGKGSANRQSGFAMGALDELQYHADFGGASRFFYCAKPSRAERGEENDHTTVKPIDLMRWLCRLVTPPGGTVLDPFTGSGTTGCAAALEGFDFIGIEREAEYVAIANARIAYWWKQPVQLGLEAA